MMDFIKAFLNGVGIFFICYMVGYSTYLFLAVLAGSSTLYRQNKMLRLKNELTHDYYVPITIIVPAYNEEVTVADTVRSLLELDYRMYEIVVVNDGSSDRTEAVLVETFQMHEVRRPLYRRIRCKKETAIYETDWNNIHITLVSKENGGKADSLNMGINVSRYPYFICMDADSVLQKDSLAYIAKPLLEDDKIVAVGGLVRISNYAKLDHGKLVSYKMPLNPVVGMQIMEYDRSFLASRILMDRFNGNLIISGAFGLFQKEMVTLAGGYDNTTMGEDMELVVKLHVFCRLHQIPYSIRYAPNAICWSQAPSTLFDLKKQRKRWHLGLFQSMNKYRQLLFNPTYGVISFISYLYYLLYELLSPFIELFGLLTILLAYAVNLVNVPFMILFYLIYAGFGAVLTLTAFLARIYTQDIKLSVGDVARAVLMCLAETLFLRFVLAFVRATAFIGYKKKKDHWGRIKRTKININT